VGDDEQRQFGIARDSLKDVEDALGIVGVEIARGLVGEEKARFVGQGARDGDALLFASGEMVGAALELVAEAHEIEEIRGAIFHFSQGEQPGAAHGNLDVFRGGEFLEQKMELEDETDFLVAKKGEFVLVQIGDELPGDFDRAAVGLVEEAQQIEERAFAAAGRAHDGVDALGIEMKRDVVEDVDAVFLLAEKTVKVFAAEDELGIGLLLQGDVPGVDLRREREIHE
jgi:hypothetical protein